MPFFNVQTNAMFIARVKETCRVHSATRRYQREYYRTEKKLRRKKRDENEKLLSQRTEVTAHHYTSNKS